MIGGTPTTTNYLDTAICSAGTCTVPTTVANGASVYWVVRAKNPAGASPWSNALRFTVRVLPSTPTLVGPSGTDATFTPNLTWNASTDANSYDVYTNIGGVPTTTNVLDTACVAGTCTYTMPTQANGTYVYWIVRAKNPAGASPWSNALRFTVRVLPSTPTLVGPSGTGTTTPTYQWTDAGDATSYDIYTSINGVPTTTNVLAATYCAAGVCNYPSTVPAASRVYWVVKGNNSAGTGSWSSPLVFLVP
jgi:hypothetical protein